ncbi:hypothetical protein [Phaeobacter piscinae]|uniref:hypothetical protein n=1 Tax=Phaeobacter piscinae TaxID=1580596 RepID=UPI00058C0A39|nr:hypothetical protein [Phaeobacter piscinae]UTS80444.1 hypothetical protein OL67_001508 [Phaeobacter piscinae]
MFRRLALAGALPLALGACMQNAEVTAPPVTVALKNQSATAPRIQGYKELTFRTHVVLDKEKMKATGGQPSSANMREVVGARCTVESTEFKATFITPAKVNVPVLKRRPTPAYVQCNAGEQSGRTMLKPELNGTVVGGASAAGLLAAAITAGIAAGRDNWSFIGNHTSGVSILVE